MDIRIRHTWDGNPCLPEEEVQVHLSWDTDHLSVQVRAPYHSDSPPPSPPGPMDFLWEYEVVELFLLGAGERYTEIELGPHGHHLVLQLVGCRNVVRRCIPVQYQAEINGLFWQGRAIIPRTLLPDPCTHLNATAIHGSGTHRRYLSWAPLPGSHPDFHRLEAFRAMDPEHEGPQ